MYRRLLVISLTLSFLCPTGQANVSLPYFPKDQALARSFGTQALSAIGRSALYRPIIGESQRKAMIVANYAYFDKEFKLIPSEPAYYEGWDATDIQERYKHASSIEIHGEIVAYTPEIQWWDELYRHSSYSKTNLIHFLQALASQTKDYKISEVVKARSRYVRYSVKGNVELNIAEVEKTEIKTQVRLDPRIGRILNAIANVEEQKKGLPYGTYGNSIERMNRWILGWVNDSTYFTRPKESTPERTTMSIHPLQKIKSSFSWALPLIITLAGVLVLVLIAWGFKKFKGPGSKGRSPHVLPTDT